MVFYKCAISRTVPRLLSTTRTLVASRFPLLSSKKIPSVVWPQHICLRERSEMANSSESAEGKMKEQVAKQKQQQSSKSIEVRNLDTFNARFRDCLIVRL